MARKSDQNFPSSDHKNSVDKEPSLKAAPTPGKCQKDYKTSSSKNSCFDVDIVSVASAVARLALLTGDILGIEGGKLAILLAPIVSPLKKHVAQPGRTKIDCLHFDPCLIVLCLYAAQSNETRDTRVVGTSSEKSITMGHLGTRKLARDDLKWVRHVVSRSIDKVTKEVVEEQQILKDRIAELEGERVKAWDDQATVHGKIIKLQRTLVEKESKATDLIDPTFNQVKLVKE